MAVALAVVAVFGHFAPQWAIDWQPGRALVEPWRAWTAIGVHYSARHFGWNLAGLALTAWLGHVAELPRLAAWAWLAAWPLTQLGLLLEPGLLHYGGLSGVLHAGVAVVATSMIVLGSGAQRMVGAAIAAGLIAKIVAEAPWGPPLRHVGGWDIATAPLAHATGAVAGLLCTLAACLAAPRFSAPGRWPARPPWLSHVARGWMPARSSSSSVAASCGD